MKVCVHNHGRLTKNAVRETQLEKDSSPSALCSLLKFAKMISCGKMFPLQNSLLSESVARIKTKIHVETSGKWGNKYACFTAIPQLRCPPRNNKFVLSGKNNSFSKPFKEISQTFADSGIFICPLKLRKLQTLGHIYLWVGLAVGNCSYFTLRPLSWSKP